MKQAIAYAFNGVCDSTLTAKTADGVLAAAGYADAVMTRYVVENGWGCCPWVHWLKDRLQVVFVRWAIARNSSPALLNATRSWSWSRAASPAVRC